MNKILILIIIEKLRTSHKQETTNSLPHFGITSILDKNIIMDVKLFG